MDDAHQQQLPAKARRAAEGQAHVDLGDDPHAPLLRVRNQLDQHLWTVLRRLIVRSFAGQLRVRAGVDGEGGDVGEVDVQVVGLVDRQAVDDVLRATPRRDYPRAWVTAVRCRLFCRVQSDLLWPA